MKKIIALLLVAVMCFSLAACGSSEKYVSDEEFLSYIEIVELTTENCMEYLEIAEYDDLDAFDEPTGNKYIGIKIKDGYDILHLNDADILLKVAYEAKETYRFGITDDGKYEGETVNESKEEDDIKIYSSENIESIGYTYFTDDDSYYFDTDISNIQISKISGTIFKANIPEETWQSGEDGRYFNIGTKKEHTQVIEDNSFWNVELAVINVLERQDAE